MRNYWLRKILAVPLILLVASFLIFWAVRLLPGDPARLMAGMQADQKVVDTVRSRLGLDKPFAVQYEIFLRNILHGDLGTSIRSHKPVAEEIAERFPYTLSLTTVSFALAVAMGTTAGVFAAIYSGRELDHLVMVTAISGASIANFWLALLAMNLFAVRVGLGAAAGSEQLEKLHPARDYFGHAAERGDRKNVPGEHARYHSQGLHPNSTGQRSEHCQSLHQPCSPKCADPNRNHCRDEFCFPVGRRGYHGNGIQLARPWPLDGRCGSVSRLRHDPGHYAAHGRDRDCRQFCRGCVHWPDRSKDSL